MFFSTISGKFRPDCTWKYASSYNKVNLYHSKVEGGDELMVIIVVLKFTYRKTLCLSPPQMTKISPNLGGGLDNGYKIFELFLENIFFSFIIKIFLN